ncbi:hypothetical protein C8R42DRAFT_645336 [Lentinula raphanica]|nr:hypothetical protein C8R42DRAFT_645336 [Lentinula raphanica]
MSSFSAEQFQFLAKLPSDISAAVLQGQFSFDSAVQAALNVPSTCPSTATSRTPAVPPEGSLSTTITRASGSQASARRNQQIVFTFYQALSFLRATRDQDPFSGSNATKKAAWTAVFEAFHCAGGDSDTGVDWIKKKVNEFIDYHESTKPQDSRANELKVKDPKTSATSIVRQIMDVPENWTTLASCLDKISKNRLKGKNESAEESVKRRQVEARKTAIGKAIVEASLATFSRELDLKSQQSSTPAKGANQVMQDPESDDEIMLLDDSGIFIPFKVTADVKVKTEDVEMIMEAPTPPATSTLSPATSTSSPTSSRRKRTLDRSADLLKDANQNFSKSLKLQERMIDAAENQNKIMQDQHHDQMDFQNSLLLVFRDMVNTK